MTLACTELRRRLTDILQSVREEREAYIVETFDRAQAASISLEEYRLFQRYRRHRETFLRWLETATPSDVAAPSGVGQTVGLSDKEMLAVLDEVRQEFASGEWASDEPLELDQVIARLEEVARQRREAEPPAIAFRRILKRATNLGIADLAERHDDYLYGLEGEGWSSP